MQSMISKNDATVMVAVDMVESLEDLIDMFYRAIVGVGYAPQSVAFSMYTLGDELMEMFEPDWNDE